MARKVVWTYEAFADLSSLAEYIARDSVYYASSFIREIRDSALSLTQLSERGRIVPEFENSKIRELFIWGYRLIYTLEESQIIILGIIHGKRDLKKLWEKENRK